MTTVIVDCHTHTHASFDSATSAINYVDRIRRIGLDAVVICDHNNIEGALEISALDPPFRVIVGEEISTAQGELIGLFLSERIPPNRSPSWSIDAVHEQGGLVIAPHPFSRVVFTRIKRAALEANVHKIDIIEGLNARINQPADELAAIRFAMAHNLPLSAGSDGHLPQNLGRCYVRMRPFDDAAGFLENLDSATLVNRRRTPLWVAGATFAVNLARDTFRTIRPARTAS